MCPALPIAEFRSCGPGQPFNYSCPSILDKLIHGTTQAWKRGDGCIRQGLFKGCVRGGAPASLYLGVRGEGQGAGVALGTLCPSTYSPVIFVIGWGYFLEAGSHNLPCTWGGIPRGMRTCLGEGKLHR